MEILWQWHDALGVKKDMSQCSDDSETLYGELDSHAFLAKFAQCPERNIVYWWPIFSTICSCFFGIAFLINIVVRHRCQYDFPIAVDFASQKMIFGKDEMISERTSQAAPITL
ncbi:hypothetical protein PQR67_13180 [Paraburkholderia fungorum]|uniref:hypothetical protein n=1 Tax=Paraburkholderia fungorum TaxID=134537 RepID=UPI0038B6CCE7